MPNLSFGDGAVGLGIVAAMLEHRSDPIAIVSAARAAAPAPPRTRSWLEEGEEEEVDSMEMSESYTCVTTHAGERRVYPGGGTTPRRCDLSPVLFFQSPPGCGETLHEGGKFLERCHLCGKSLLGIDIFMYRGERAFCSVECRCQQILMDEHQEKCRSSMRKTYGSSTSPCLIPIHLTSHVVAA